MKSKNLILFLAGVSLMLTLWVSCNKTQTTETEALIDDSIENVVESNRRLMEKVIGYTYDQLSSKGITNTLTQMLEALDIRDEDNIRLRFPSLGKELRNAVISEYLKVQAEGLAVKLNYAPELVSYIKVQNDILETLLNRYVITTKGNESTIYDTDSFFEELATEMDNLSINTRYKPLTKSVNSLVGYGTLKKIDYNSPTLANTIKNATNSLRAGDIFITLPNPNNPHSLVNFGDTNNECVFGHTEVVCDRFETLEEHIAKFSFRLPDGRRYNPDKCSLTYVTYRYDTRLVTKEKSYQGFMDMSEIIEFVNRYCGENGEDLATATTQSQIEQNIRNYAVLEKQTVLERYLKELKEKYNGQIGEFTVYLDYLTESGQEVREYFALGRPVEREAENEQINEYIYHTQRLSNGYSNIINVLHIRDVFNPLTLNTLTRENLIGCTTDRGVTRKNMLSPWAGNPEKWYVLGIKTRIIYINQKTKKCTTVFNEDKNASFENLVKEMSRHEGKPYTSAFEFAFAKAAAPNKFTCTSIIWYAAKKTLDIDLSKWYSTVVSPSDIYLSDYTYVKNTITPKKDWVKE